MKISKKFKCPGIYVIKNSINGKIYVGKSKNCYNRLHQHIYDINTENRNYNENPHLLNAVKKYGIDNFECYLVEKINPTTVEDIEKILSEKELSWMQELNSLDPNIGYNLRFDSNGKCYCSNETSKKISDRLKSEWKSGVRSNHSNKMKEYWKNTKDRKLNQSKVMSKNKTKYIYDIYKDNNLLIKSGTYEDLKGLNLESSCFSYFSRHKTNEYDNKNTGYKVIRNIISKEIVQSDEKSSGN